MFLKCPIYSGRRWWYSGRRWWYSGRRWWYSGRRWWYSGRRWWYSGRRWWYSGRRWWYSGRRWWYSGRRWWYSGRRWWYSGRRWWYLDSYLLLSLAPLAPRYSNSVKKDGSYNSYWWVKSRIPISWFLKWSPYNWVVSSMSSCIN